MNFGHVLGTIVWKLNVRNCDGVGVLGPAAASVFKPGSVRGRAAHVRSGTAWPAATPLKRSQRHMLEVARRCVDVSPELVTLPAEVVKEHHLRDSRRSF